MVLTVHSADITHAVGLTQSASDGFSEANTAGEFADEQTGARWSYNSEAFNFAQAYRTRLLDMQQKMDEITALVEQFQQGLVDSEAEIEGVDEVVASHMDLVGGEVDGTGYQARTAVPE